MIQEVGNMEEEISRKSPSHKQGKTKEIGAGTGEVLGTWRKGDVTFNLGV